jgi:cysteine desulfurase
MKRIYFDANATTKMDKRVLKVFLDTLRHNWGNPSSLYYEGKKAATALQEARKKVAVALGCDEDEIFFVSSSSEAISWVAKMRKIVVSPYSHHSMKESQKDCNPKLIDTHVVGIPEINNETGRDNIIDTSFIWNIDKEYLFVDLTATVGKEKINLHENSNILYACCSGHKFGAGLGCGVLYIKKSEQGYVQPLIYGSQEKGYRGGTENIPAIVAFGEAIKIATNEIGKNNKKIKEILDYIINKIKSEKVIQKGMFQEVWYKKPSKIRKSSNVINITFEYLLAQTSVMLFDKYGICVSAGSACNSGDDKPSEVLLANGYSKEEALRTIRVSISKDNTKREAKRFVKILNIIVDKYDKE